MLVVIICYYLLLFAQNQRLKDIRQRQEAQEEAMAREMEIIKNEQLRDDKMRQRVRETRLTKFLFHNVHGCLV